MSGVKRFDPHIEWKGHDHGVLVEPESATGRFVRFEDYERMREHWLAAIEQWRDAEKQTPDGGDLVAADSRCSCNSSVFRPMNDPHWPDYYSCVVCGIGYTRAFVFGEDSPTASQALQAIDGKVYSGGICCGDFDNCQRPCIPREWEINSRTPKELG